MSAGKERYDAIDGLRVISMAGILVMHVLANLSYREELSWLYRYIVYLGDFTALFMIVSAFSVNCGYYEKIKKGGYAEIDKFYHKRYRKLFPFFFVLSFIDVVLAPSAQSVYEGIANATLAFGLIPHESITVIGVGWTLGVIFLFYLLYPFFVFCMSEKKRFIAMGAATVFFAFISNEYFSLGKVDFLFCAVYFMAGCGLYLCRDRLRKLNRWVVLAFVVMIGYLFFVFPQYHAIKKLFFMISLVLYAIVASGKKTILSNVIVQYINQYSFEIYLCHMMAYRIVEKVGLLRLFDSALLSYVIVSVIVFALSFLCAFIFKIIEKKLG